MKRITLSGNSAAASLTGFASNVTGATWTLSANDAGDSLAHKVTIRNDSVTDHTGKTITLTGTDADGRPLTETLAGPDTSATVTSAGYYLTLTSVTVSATIGADTFDIGYAAASISPTYWVPRDLAPQFNIGFGCRVVSGSPNYGVQHTYDGTAWYDHISVAAETTSQDGAYTSPIAGMRVAWTVAGSVTLTAFQLGV